MRQTPYYVFDTDEFAKRAAMIRAALDCKGGRRIPLCFSIKANPFLLHRLPAGLDHVEVCSPGELDIFNILKRHAKLVATCQAQYDMCFRFGKLGFIRTFLYTFKHHF